MGALQSNTNTVSPNLPSDLPVFKGPLAGAVSEARKRAKYLLMFLHSPLHPDSVAFLQQQLTNPALIQMLKKDFIVWSASVLEPTGYQCMLNWGATTFPYVAVQFKSDIVLRMQGPFPLEHCINALNITMTKTEHIRAEEITWVTDREQREMLRAMQEKELEEATAKDLERQEASRQKAEAAARAAAEAKARAEEEARLKAEEEERLRQEEEDRRRQEEEEQRILEEKKAIAMSMLPDEAESIAGVPPSQLACIRLVMLNGVARERKFPATAPVSHIYAFAEAQPEYDNRPYYCSYGVPPRTLPRDDSLVGDHKMLLGRCVVTMRAQLSPTIGPANPPLQ
jgi:hypothetical protein